jgi:PAS domain S-box-containing protein
MVATLVSFTLTGSAQAWAINGGWMVLGVAVVTALAGTRRRVAPAARRPWTLLLAGAVCWAFGEALWVLWLVVPVPSSPNLADLGWYAFAILTAVGLHQYARGAQPQAWVVRAEIAPIAAAACALVAALVWTRLVESPLGVAEKASALAYPALFVSSALAVAQLVTSGAVRPRQDPGLALIFFGFTLEALGFILWCPALLDGTYVAGTHACDVIWSVGIACMALGACVARGAPASLPEHRRLGALLPGITLAALVAVQLRYIIEDAATTPRLIVAGAVAAVGVSLLVRSSILNREQLRLLERERRASADAEAARNELDGFFNLSIGLLGVSDLEGRFRRLNPAWTETLGWPLEDLLTRPFLDFVHPEDVVATVREMESLETGADSLDFQNRYRCLDGSYRWLAWKCRPDPGAGIIYATAVDVTDLRNISAELAGARDRALEASRQKSEFLAMMSHEIRTPLNGVIGMTHLLAETNLDAEQRGYADTVSSSGEALLTIINDILDFSKIEAGRLELDRVDFDLRETIESVGEQLAGRAHEKGLELALDIGEDLPRCVHGDPSRLRQILTNLIGNAVKFTPTGEIVVSARGEVASGGDVLLRCEVRDTGVGVDPADLPRLFESFTQADSSTTRRFGGSGLGLAICKRLAERMGGEIGASSAPGAGSTFWFTLRLSKVHGRVPSEPRVDLAGVRVLVVDDNATNREILEQQLRSWGMRPETAEDARSALRRMRAAARRDEAHELLLLDFNMPRMNGVELARAVSGDAELTGVPMILLTSSGGHSVAGREAGIDTFLTKPVRQSRLFDAMARIMGGGAGPGLELPAPGGMAEVAAPEGDDTPGARVLVAEDNEVNQAVATITLRKRGFLVEIAPDGAAAVDMAARGTYAAIFMDCQMPVLDGYGATREIRRREDTGTRVPIIAMTASAMRGDRERCLAAGMDDYLTKPLRLDDLDRVLDAWVRPDEEAGGGIAGAPAGQDTLAHLREVLGGDPGLVAEVIELFCTDATRRLDDLDVALAMADFDGLRRTAHALKGSSANVGAAGVTQLAERAERHAEDGDGVAAAAAVAHLHDEVARAVTALRSELAAPA